MWPSGTTATVVITGQEIVIPARPTLPETGYAPARIWLIAIGDISIAPGISALPFSFIAVVLALSVGFRFSSKRRAGRY